jgi:hypothetical protein
VPASAPAPTPPQPAPQTQQQTAAVLDGPMVYQCTNQQVLRVVFDAADRTASVRQYGRPPITLRLASGAASFRYTRSGYELSGTASEVNWRIGSGDPLRCTRHSW